MVRRGCLIVFLVFSFLVAAGAKTAAGQSKNSAADDSVAAYSLIAPPFVAPRKDQYVTREGDPFILVVTATCLLEDDSDAQFELLSPTPDFVGVSSTYHNANTANGYAEGLAVLYISPQIGDAGKHRVSLQVKACSGKVERVINFTVKVKQAPQG